MIKQKENQKELIIPENEKVTFSQIFGVLKSFAV